MQYFTHTLMDSYAIPMKYILDQMFMISGLGPKHHQVRLTLSLPVTNKLCAAAHMGFSQILTFASNIISFMLKSVSGTDLSM